MRRKFETILKGRQGSVLALLILISLVTVIIKQNFASGQWLLGWDNFAWEFDTRLSLQRAIFGVWQEYYGLSLLPGMAQASALPQVMLYLLLDIFLPTTYLRWIWTIAMLISGPTGTFFLLRSAFEKEPQQDYSKTSQAASLVGSLYYSLNLVMVQYFYTPLEPFVAFYGLSPWLLFLSRKALTTRSVRWIILFALASFVTSSMFYVQTMYVVWMLIFVWWLAVSARAEKQRRILKTTLLLIAINLIANSYWLLPTTYSAIKNSQVAVQSKQNQLATPENILFDQGRGSLLDFALLRGFWFDYSDVTIETGESIYLMSEWRKWLDQEMIEGVGLSLFAMAIAGIAISLFDKSYRLRYLGLGWLLLVCFMLWRQMPLFFWWFNLLSTHVPLFGQIFRAAFTKWSLVGTLVNGYGLAYLVRFFSYQSKYWSRITAIVLVGLIVSGMMLVIWPIFRGQLIYEKMKVKLPEAYDQLFTWFNDQPKQARIAHLPAHTIWGWNYYSWGYRGSGFLWYGIEQPILDRAFDVWSAENETFYHELSRAIYGCPRLNPTPSALTSEVGESFKACAEDVSQVLEKYDVSYALIDESIVSPGEPEAILRLPETREVLTQLGWNRVFAKPIVACESSATDCEEQMLEVWQGFTNHQFVWSPESYQKVEADTIKVRKDVVYEEIGSYISSPGVSTQSPDSSSALATIYPFAHVYREEPIGVSFIDLGFSANKVRFTRPLTYSSGSKLITPGLTETFPLQLTGSIEHTGSHLLVQFDAGIKFYLDGRDLEALPQLPQIQIPLEPEQSRLIIKIGEEVVHLNQGETKLLNSITTKVGDDLLVSVYDPLGETINGEPDFFASEANRCWTRSGGVPLTETASQSGVLTARVMDASLCLSQRLGSRDVDGLMEVSLSYRSPDGARPHFCITEEGQETYQCLNRDIFYETESDTDWRSVIRHVSADAEKVYWLDTVARASDVPQKSWTIQYQSPTIKWHPLLIESRLDPLVWEAFRRPKSIELNPGKDLTLELTVEPENINLASAAGVEVDNCDVFDRGAVRRVIYEKALVYFASDRGAACDAISLPSTSNQQEYLLRVIGENKGSRSLKYYLYNHESGRNDLEILLNEGIFDQAFGINSWPHLNPDSYLLSLETRSFGREEAINRLDKALVYPVSLDWLSRVKIEPTGGLSVQSNQLQIDKAHKWGTSHYLVHIYGTGLLALSQGYDDGWLAYDLGESCDLTSLSCKLKFIFPWLFGSRLDHFRLNGWANGWIIPDTKEPSGSAPVAILYWPQYLEWVGLFVLTLTFGFLSFQVTKDRG